ncbi:MAG: alpha/beta hydrolase [Pseudobdellovibrionaceae bacterium]
MRKLGPIQCLEAHPKVEPKEGQQPLTFLLFHGYGADAYDLKSLAEVIQTPTPTHFLFPQGVLEVPIGPGWTGRAWWPIDIMALQEAALRGEPRDLSRETTPGIGELRKKVFAAIESLKTPWNQIILGGFSQGAMLATDIFLNAPENPRALVSLSGALVNKDEWKALIPRRAGVPFFASHGKMDAVLDHRCSAQLETFLTQAGMKGKLFSFNGAHEIPMEAIVRLNEFLKDVAK